MSKILLEMVKELDYQSNEAYKSLRTNIRFCGNDVKVICFTSSIPNEGKSNVSFQLASSLAESGLKTLFLDADLRKSVIVGRYKPDHSVLGLTHYLSGQNKLDEVIYESNITNLDIVFTGPVPPNPAELLGNEHFALLLRKMRSEYHYIIVDTPPLGSVIDSAIVAAQCDGAVIVIESDAISYKLAQRVKMQLEKSGCKILGAVLNKIDLSSNQYHYYGKKYKYYGKYANEYY